jgi:hypothetical protein
MNTVLAKWMTLFISVTIMFTPLLAYLDALHREAVDTVLYEKLKEASIQGHFTTDMIDDMKETLQNDYNFDRSQITITADLSIKPRGQFIRCTIEVPRGPIYILNIFNQGDTKIKRTAQIMSEYIAN